MAMWSDLNALAMWIVSDIIGFLFTSTPSTEDGVWTRTDYSMSEIKSGFFCFFFCLSFYLFIRNPL